MTQANLTLQEIAEATGAELVGDPNQKISGVADLNSASSQDVSFIISPKYESDLQQSSAGAVFMPHGFPLPKTHNFLLHQDPSGAIQQIMDLLYSDPGRATGFDAIHPTAIIHPTSTVDEGVTLAPYVVIDANCHIGQGTWIGAGSYIGPETTIGQDCTIDPNVTIRQKCTIGNRVTIQSGAALATCGYGFLTRAEGKHERIKHIGSLIIEDDVEIGANATVDRARFASTIISRGSKIDNQVLIGHNVTIGEDNLIIGQSAIAGSSSTGNHVVIAGQSAVGGHLHITDRVMVAAKSGVSKSVTKPGKYRGVPILPLDEYNRNYVLLRNIKKLVEEVQSLKKTQPPHQGVNVCKQNKSA